MEDCHTLIVQVYQRSMAVCSAQPAVFVEENWKKTATLIHDIYGLRVSEPVLTTIDIPNEL